ncbi:hypothetical protein EMIT0158MI4_60040 [Burkholderia ambifaria]
MAIHALLREWPFHFFRYIRLTPQSRGNPFRLTAFGKQSRATPPHGGAGGKQVYTMHLMRRSGAFNAPCPIELKQFVSVAPGVRAYP